MSARAERWSPPDARLVTAAVASAVFLVSWGLIHRGFYDERPIVDTGVYQSYGDKIRAGQVPYRDFDVEYPPGALPVFAAPSFAPADDYVPAFEWLMAALGVVLVVVVGSISPAAAAFVAVSPLLVGSLLLSRFDLWPALLSAGSVVALLRGRHRLGWGLLGAAVAAKLYPLVLVGPALAWSWRRGRARAAGAGLVVLAAVVLPFLVIAPDGVWRSVHGQASRPLQVESIGAAALQVFGDPRVETSHGSQNVVGHGAVATALVVAQALAVLAVWALAWRRPEDLPRWAAAAVAAFVAFGKVLSPQFLVWLVPLVPLVRGRRGVGATAVLATALLLTQVWFPRRYWDYVGTGERASAVLARDLALVALFALLATPLRRERTRTT